METDANSALGLAQVALRNFPHGTVTRERLDEFVAAVQPALDRRATLPRSWWPASLTPELREVLGLMNFVTCPIAHQFRAAGAEIPPKVEEEQAYVLHWLVGLALEHGADWCAKADERIDELTASLGREQRTVRHAAPTPDDQWDDFPSRQLRSGLRRYLEDRVRPGDFLCAVLRNDLADACRRADDVNRPLIGLIVRWLDAYAPSDSWGSPAAFDKWLSATGDAA